MPDPTLRFSSRVDNYVKYRPRYPRAVLTALQDACQLTAVSPIADIGSGTGFLTELFLQNGNPVYAVEPNAEMRAAGERLVAHYPNFHSISGRAEATTLPDQCVDFVVAGQAFHWFDQAASRREFGRILRLGGWVVLVWNERRAAGTPFLTAYEQLLQRYATDYNQINHTQIGDAELNAFYGPGGFASQQFDYRQQFDYEGLQGRLLSSSYTPEAGQPNHEPMLADLRQLFAVHAVNGRVNFDYVTTLYYGRLT
jgi:SAM-dependent methyltransferase